MLSYETLDAIADSYNPLLALISIVSIGKGMFKPQWKMTRLRLIAFITVVIVAYGLMFLDRKYNLWVSWGLDYSTHTAVALGLVLFLSFDFDSVRLTILWAISFVGYVLLMLYQQYHTISDIVTTGIAVGVPIALVLTWLYQSLKDKMAASFEINV